MDKPKIGSDDIRIITREIMKNSNIHKDLSHLDLDLGIDNQDVLESYSDYVFECFMLDSTNVNWLKTKILEMIEIHEKYDSSYGLHNYGMILAEKLPKDAACLLRDKVQKVIESRKRLNDQLPSSYADLCEVCEGWYF